MRFAALATDYDETLADEGRVTDASLDALGRLKASGRRLLLVTGRELNDLRRVFPRCGGLCDAIVAENGAVLWLPQAREERLLAEPPPAGFAQALRRRKVPISTGRVIVATREPHEADVLGQIREQGLELQVIFNKGAVMVLPSGVNKGTGLVAGLRALGLSSRNCVACGDAENDHAFLHEAELGVAVQNALPRLRERADVVTRSPAGRGVAEVIAALLEDGGEALAARSQRRWLQLGLDGTRIPPWGSRVLFNGQRGSGRAFIERLVAAGYQCVILDPDGDHEDFEGTLVLGDNQRAPTLDEALQVLEKPGEQLVLNLRSIDLGARPGFLAALLPRLHQLRARTGRPHWLVLDQAHQLLPESAQATAIALAKESGSLALFTAAPQELARPVLDGVNQAR